MAHSRVAHTMPIGHLMTGRRVGSMHPALAHLVAPFERITVGDARALLAERYHLDAERITRIETERDDTFRVTAGADDLVLKVAHPQDGEELIDLQVRALVHAREADPSLPLQSIIRTADGELATAWDGRVARVFRWMDGAPARGLAPTPAQLRAAGTMLGRLNRALADFEHPAADRVLAWDLAQVSLLRELDPAPPVLEIIERAERLVLPAVENLPRQVIHNDFHPGNLLVEPASPAYISGILDFGDTVRSARVNDLGVALAYLSMGSSPWEAAAPFLDGFESVVPLLDAERALLPHLVAVRLAQRVLLNALLERDASENSTLGGL